MWGEDGRETYGLSLCYDDESGWCVSVSDYINGAEVYGDDFIHACWDFICGIAQLRLEELGKDEEYARDWFEGKVKLENIPNEEK
jgi:hypothetical protein